MAKFLYIKICVINKMTMMNFGGMNYYFQDWLSFSGFTMFGATIGILFLAFWVWMIVDCAKRNFKNSNEKIVWILVILFAKIIGALIYFFVVKNRK